MGKDLWRNFDADFKSGFSFFYYARFLKYQYFIPNNKNFHKILFKFLPITYYANSYGKSKCTNLAKKCTTFQIVCLGVFKRLWSLVHYVTFSLEIPIFVSHNRSITLPLATCCYNHCVLMKLLTNSTQLRWKQIETIMQEMLL